MALLVQFEEPLAESLLSFLTCHSPSNLPASPFTHNPYLTFSSSTYFAMILIFLCNIVSSLLEQIQSLLSLIRQALDLFTPLFHLHTHPSIHAPKSRYKTSCRRITEHPVEILNFL